MEQKTYHGSITPRQVAEALVARFSGDDMTVAVSGDDDKMMLNISSTGWRGGRTALAVGLSPVRGGVMVTVGEHNLLGVAADLLQTGLGALRNPLTIIGEIDDVARNVEHLNLPAQVWEAVDLLARSLGAGMTPAPTSVTCPYCGVLNPIGAGQCESCGAPLGRYQPVACSQCGLVLPADIKYCTRCGSPLRPGTAPAAKSGRRAASRGEPATADESRPVKPKIVAKFQ